MSHTVLDGLGNVKSVRSLGAGTVDDPLLMVVKRNSNALVDDGKLFYHADRHTVANNATFNYLLRTSTTLKTTLYDFIINCTASPFFVDIFENTIVSANGTAEGLYNQNRISTTTASGLLYMTPTITSDGTNIFSDVVYGDKTSGGGGQSDFRLILKASTNYVFRFLNQAGASSNIAIAVRFSET